MCHVYDYEGQGAWWTVLPTDNPGHSTYGRVRREDLPPIPDRLTASIAWLTDLPAAEGSIIDSDQPERPLRPDATTWLEDQGVPSQVLPASLVRLAEYPELLAGIRSPTACFVDLGSKVVPLAPEAGGGWLLRLLSDSQLVLSWLIHLSPGGAHRLVVTPAYLGYEWGAEPDEPYAIPDRALLSSDLAQLEVEPCANSLPEFLARLWLEGETWWSLHGQPSPSPEVAEYQRAWRARFL